MRPTRRYQTRAPLTEAQLTHDGPPIKLRDLVATTGWHKKTLIADIDQGTLKAFRRTEQTGSAYYVKRPDALAYLSRMGWTWPVDVFHVPRGSGESTPKQ